MARPSWVICAAGRLHHRSRHRRRLRRLHDRHRRQPAL